MIAIVLRPWTDADEIGAVTAYPVVEEPMCGLPCAKHGCDETCVLPPGHEGDYCSCAGPNGRRGVQREGAAPVSSPGPKGDENPQRESDRQAAASSAQPETGSGSAAAAPGEISAEKKARAWDAFRRIWWEFMPEGHDPKDLRTFAGIVGEWIGEWEHGFRRQLAKEEAREAYRDDCVELVEKIARVRVTEPDGNFWRDEARALLFNHRRGG